MTFFSTVLPQCEMVEEFFWWYTFFWFFAEQKCLSLWSYEDIQTARETRDQSVRLQ